MEDRNTEDYGKLLRELLEQKQYTKLLEYSGSFPKA